MKKNNKPFPFLLLVHYNNKNQFDLSISTYKSPSMPVSEILGKWFRMFCPILFQDYLDLF